MPLKYGAYWNERASSVEIELACIQREGRWTDEDGKTCGNGLAFHIQQLQKLLCPEKDWHRWNTLIVEKMCSHDHVAILGPASSGKSHELAFFCLCMYWADPNRTTIMVSSTTREMLNLRIWGEIKKYFLICREREPRLPGYITESKFCITTDGKDVEARDFRNGIVGRPCVVNGRFLGLGDYAGVKNYRVIMVVDEAQFMPGAFLKSMSNINKNPRHKLIALGNPKDPTDSLGLAAEPHKSEGGWEGIDRTPKTKTWKTRWPGGICVQLVGTDSPNHDFPADKEPYPWMIGRKTIATDEEFYGHESVEFYMMDLGMMPLGQVSKRVISRNMCEKYFALESPVWDGTERPIKIFALDAGYGGDRCVGGEFHLGRDLDGKQILAFVNQPIIVPVNANDPRDAEEQIAEFVMNKCNELDIPPEHVCFDCTGRGVLGSTFGRIWSSAVVPVSFEGRPTDRPVTDGAAKVAKEAYGKFVSELWFAARDAITSGQIRGMTESIMLEGCKRKVIQLPGNKKDVEPKWEMKAATGISPDLFDMFVVGIEGARRLGFTIKGANTTTVEQRLEWLYRRGPKLREIERQHELQTMN